MTDLGRMMAGFLALTIVIMKLFPETALSRSLHRYLVELPLEMARRIERRDIILVAIILCCGQTLALAGSVDLAMAYAVDMSIYADAALATSIAAAAACLKSSWQFIGATLARLVRGVARPRPRSRRSRPAPTRSDKSSNDNDHPGLAVLAA